MKKLSVGIAGFVMGMCLIAPLSHAANRASGIDHLGKEISGIDLTVGPNSGMVSCGYDRVMLDGKMFSHGVGVIRVYFNLHTEVGRSQLASRMSCVLRLKEFHREGTQLSILWARVYGSTDLGPGVRGSLGLSVGSTGSQRMTVSDDLDFNGSFQDVITEEHPGECLSRDTAGFFSLNMAATLQTNRQGNFGNASIDYVDIYVKEEACQ